MATGDPAKGAASRSACDRILVASRKGLFDVRRRGRGWRVGEPRLKGQTIAYAVRDPRNGSVWASLDHGHWGAKLARARDDGGTFAEAPPPRFPEGLQHGGKPVGARYYWVLEPGLAVEPEVSWIGTEPGGLFRTTDDGATWTLVTSLWEARVREAWAGGGRLEPGIHSIALDPRDPRRLHVAVSCGGTYETSDAGATWTPRNAGVESTGPEGVDVHLLRRAPSEPDVLWQANHMGVYRSADGGRSWATLTKRPYVDFGFPIAVHPRKAKTAWIVPMEGDAARMAIGGALLVMRTEDGGKRWREQREGLPQRDAWDFPLRHALDVAPDGSTLAMGTTSGNLYVSEDGGDSWKALARNLPPVYSVRFA